MVKSPSILAIETSCDETSAAIVNLEKYVLSNVVATQVEFHKAFGGVVPEIASRKHVELLNLVIDDSMKRAPVSPTDIVAVAATRGPGLIGALLIGMTAAKVYAYVWGKKLIFVDHIEAHIWANFLNGASWEFPAVCLVVSGGHTSLYYLDERKNITLLGETIDDAVGEAYDKVARVLGLSYPGGPAIEKAALESKLPVEFPRPMLSTEDFNFSLSGLKTAVSYYVQKRGLKNINVSDVACGFQNAIAEVLAVKLRRAVIRFKPKSVLTAGGVIANRAIRLRIDKELRDLDIPISFPQFEYCTDNAAMIGARAADLFSAGKANDFKVEAYSITRTGV